MRSRRRRRTEEFDSTAVQLRHARARLEILAAVTAGVERREEVLHVVAAAPDTARAREEIMQLLDLDPVSATAVLDLQVRRFTVAERQKIQDEQAELRAIIRELGG